MQSPTLRALYVVFGIIALALLAFQLYFLDSYSIWHDEAFSGLLVNYELPEMLHRITLDVHPPLYYLLLRVWTDLIGNTTLTLRLFSVVFGCIAAYLTWRVSYLLTRNKEIAFATAFLFFANSFVIQHNMEARMYTMGISLILGTLLAALTALNRTGNDRWKAWGFFALLATAALYTHYYTVFYIVAIGIAVLALIWQQKHDGGDYLASLKGLFGASALVGVLYLPWLPIFIAQAKQVAADYWIGPMNAWSIPATLWKLLTGVNAHPGSDMSIGGMSVAWTSVLVMMSIALLVAFYGVIWTRSMQLKEVLFAIVIIPFIASAIVSAKTSIYLDRYFIYSTPFLALLLVVAVYRIPKYWLRYGIMCVLLVGIAASFPARFKGLDMPNKPGMRVAATYLNSNVAPSDTIVVGSSFVFFTHRYYNTLPNKPLLLGNNLVHYSGTALIDPEEVITDLSTIPRGGNIWTMDTTGFGNYQLSPPANWEKMNEYSYDDIYDHRGTIIVRKYQFK